MQHKNDDDDDDDDDLENNDANMNKKPTFHEASLLPTPFLHPAGSSILTSSFSFLKLKIMKFMENKMLEVLLGQEAVRH